MNANGRIGIVLGLLLTWSVSAAEIEVLGVAKVGDGSETDKAWSAYQETKRNSFEAQKALSDAGRSATAARAGVYKYTPTPADWMVNVKRMPCPESRGAGSYCVSARFEGEGKDGGVWMFTLIQGADSGDWIAIKNGVESGPEEGTLQAQLAMIRGFLQKAGQPMSAEQERRLTACAKEALDSELVPVWEKVQTAPADKALAAGFVAAVVKAKAGYADKMKSASAKMMEILTPEQLAAMGAPKGGVQESHGSASSSGPGSFSASSMTSNGKQQVTYVIAGMRLADAFRSLVGSVNTSFSSKLTEPEVSADLAGKIVSVKIVLEGPDGALEKLAAAAGAKLEARDGKTQVVAAEK
jgi:hypothetical protein